MQKTTSHFDYTKINFLSNQILQNIDSVLRYFQIPLRKDDRKYVGCCPVHGGDRCDAFNLYHSTGHWVCRSRHCEEHFKKTPLGLIRGLLSQQKYSWLDPSDKEASFPDTIKWVTSFLKVSLNNIKESDIELDKSKFAHRMSESSCYAKPENLLKIPRRNIVNNLHIPSDYYINRGYSKEILKKFDVGLSLNPTKPRFFERVVVPVYDSSGNFMVGCSGRSIWPFCIFCKQYHKFGRPCVENSPKWNHNFGFDASKHLYNQWGSKQNLGKTGHIILVESPGNVWRLEEAGLKNGVAVFGSALKPGQKDLLDIMGVLHISVVFDNDDAGKRGAQNIVEKYGQQYNIDTVSLPSNINDIGEMTPGDVKGLGL